MNKTFRDLTIILPYAYSQALHVNAGFGGLSKLMLHEVFYFLSYAAANKTKLGFIRSVERIKSICTSVLFQQ